MKTFYKIPLYLDMDGTIVDTASQMDYIFNNYFVDENHWRVPMTDGRYDKSSSDFVELECKLDQIPGLFSYHIVEPMVGALSVIEKLVATGAYDLHIITTAPWYNQSAWTDKIEWVQHYFGRDPESPFYKKVHLTHNKHQVIQNEGILIDDRSAHGAGLWDNPLIGSVWIQYDYNNLVWDGKLETILLALAERFNAYDGVGQPPTRDLFHQVLKNDIHEKHHDEDDFTGITNDFPENVSKQPWEMLYT
ncbi:MAG: hypothetical protein LBN08_05070 [Lactobacillales bacterium]|jgi:5'(3')-deoxyribonucleotidase|nr:hypothetical protein [Lactobacillales bacterium]